MFDLSELQAAMPVNDAHYCPVVLRISSLRLLLVVHIYIQGLRPTLSSKATKTVSQFVGRKRSNNVSVGTVRMFIEPRRAKQ